MPLIKQPSESELDIINTDAAILGTGAAVHTLAHTLAAHSREFRALPLERALAVLNSDVPKALRVYALHAALSAICNKVLDNLDEPGFPVRVPAPGASIQFNRAGGFFEPTPLPELPPEPADGPPSETIPEPPPVDNP